MSKELIIFPFGGNAREAIAAIQSINKLKKTWNILGFIDDDSSLWERDFYGIKVLGGKNVLLKHPQARVLAVPGSPDNYLKRKSIINGLEIEASRFIKILSPTTFVSPGVAIGYNTLILPNVVIGPDVFVGNHCVILPNTVISHDSVIGDYCCVGANVVISGWVKIDSNCYIGSGSCIKNNVTIGEKSLVGIGSNVILDVPREVVVAGNPAKILTQAGK